MKKTKNKNPRDPKFKNFKVYALKILEKHEIRHLFKFRETFKEFWRKYCQTFDLSFDDLMSSEKIPRQASNYLRRIRCEGIPKIQTTTKDVDNHLIISYQDRKRVKKKKKTDKQDSTELETIEENTDELTDTFYRKKKKIVAINFTSEITENTVNRINEACKYKDLLTRDYLYYNNGGQDDYEKLPDGTIRKRFKDQLTHLQMTVSIRNEVNKMSKELLKNINDVSLLELKEMNKKIDTFKKLIDSARNLDLQAVEFLQKMSDDDFSTQKALNGAIINDNTMTVNGQLVVKGKKKKQELTTESFKEDLEAIAQGIFNKQVDSISTESENKENIIEGEIMENEQSISP